MNFFVFRVENNFDQIKLQIKLNYKCQFEQKSNYFRKYVS